MASTTPAATNASDVGAWKPGYENRRISVSFLFGDPSHVVVAPEPAGG